MCPTGKRSDDGMSIRIRRFALRGGLNQQYPSAPLLRRAVAADTLLSVDRHCKKHLQFLASSAKLLTRRSKDWPSSVQPNRGVLPSAFCSVNVKMVLPGRTRSIGRTSAQPQEAASRPSTAASQSFALRDESASESEHRPVGSDGWSLRPQVHLVCKPAGRTAGAHARLLAAEGQQPPGLQVSSNPGSPKLRSYEISEDLITAWPALFGIVQEKCWWWRRWWSLWWWSSLLKQFLRGNKI